MFASHLFSVFLAISPILAIPASPSPAATCQTALNGNLSPNGVSGNFRMVDNVLAFDPTNIATAFDVSVQSCASSSAAAKAMGVSSVGHLLASSTGQCLAVQNATSTTGPTVVGVDCATTGGQTSMNWAIYDDFVFWASPGSEACSTGLYGYQALSSGGSPAAVQKAPITLGCSTDETVFGFSVLY